MCRRMEAEPSMVARETGAPCGPKQMLQHFRTEPEILWVCLCAAGADKCTNLTRITTAKPCYLEEGVEISSYYCQ
jgi:hypothetical protein